MKERRVSEAVIRRLPRYCRHLEHLHLSGVERISSSELAAQLSLNPSQVRQDLNCFGGFGQQGYGYHVETLFMEIKQILGINRRYKIIIAGAGNIGQALCKYEGFAQKGFDVVALFDNDPSLIGKSVADCPVLDVKQMRAYIEKEQVEIGIVAARRHAAQELADQMVQGGVKGIWNFVPADITATVPVEDVRLIDSLFVLSYHMTKA